MANKKKASKKNAKRTAQRKEWTPEELQMVNDRELTVEQIAKKTGRTVGSVTSKRNYDKYHSKPSKRAPKFKSEGKETVILHAAPEGAIVKVNKRPNEQVAIAKFRELLGSATGLKEHLAMLDRSVLIEKGGVIIMVDPEKVDHVEWDGFSMGKREPKNT